MLLGGRRVLAAIDLAVAPATVLGLLGPGGSGKSALLAVVAGFLRPRAGHIVVDGTDITRRKPHRRGFGVVLQGDAPLACMRLAQGIGFPLEVRGVRRRQRMALVEHALELVGLAGAGELRPAEATAGQRFLAVLARAIVFEPGVLLLDEPLAGLDPSERELAGAAVRRVRQRLGAAILLATREAADALALADQVAVLRHGRIVQEAAPDAVYDRPADAGVAAMLGGMTLLPGLVREIEDGEASIALDCGPVVEAEAAGGLRAGEKCLLWLRPERLAVAPVAVAAMSEGAIEARVIEARRLGDQMRLLLLIGSGAELVVLRPALASAGLMAGRQVAVAWQPGHALAFPILGPAAR